MTSRERVLMALNHSEPDRVPLDMGGSFVTGIAATALHHLRRHLGLEDRPVKVYDAFQMLGEVEMDVVNRLQLDCLPVHPSSLTMGLKWRDWKPWTLMDGTEVLIMGDFDVSVTGEGDWLFHQGGDPSNPPVCRMPKDGYYFDTIGYGDFNMDWEPPPLDELTKSWGDRTVSDEELQFLVDQADRNRTTDKASVLGAWPYLGLDYIGSLTDFWALLGRDPGYVKALFAASTEWALVNLKRLWDALGDKIDVICVTGLDFGTQRTEYFDPNTFIDVYEPFLRQQFQWVKQNTSWKSFEHCDGSITNLIPHMVEYGLDALNPLQTSAAGMDPAWLKETFGDRLSFWGGGTETQSTLPFGTPEEVREEVRERIRILAPGGGFVFNPIHNIQPNTPAENIAAAYEAAREFGAYPI
ncbi:MAG TPA: uroporphyrinogen decarboxylase family protein [Armatimonadota bacterium]|nr:uroporphyrinogen decarboxylase family protein [Armatimonadota bacterium]